MLIRMEEVSPNDMKSNLRDSNQSVRDNLSSNSPCYICLDFLLHVIWELNTRNTQDSMLTKANNISTEDNLASSPPTNGIVGRNNRTLRDSLRPLLLTWQLKERYLILKHIVRVLCRTTARPQTEQSLIHLRNTTWYLELGRELAGTFWPCLSVTIYLPRWNSFTNICDSRRLPTCPSPWYSFSYTAVLTAQDIWHDDQ